MNEEIFYVDFIESKIKNSKGTGVKVEEQPKWTRKATFLNESTMGTVIGRY